MVIRIGYAIPKRAYSIHHYEKKLIRTNRKVANRKSPVRYVLSSINEIYQWNFYFFRYFKVGLVLKVISMMSRYYAPFLG